MTEETAEGGPSRAAKNQFALFAARRFWPLFSVQFLGAFNDQTFKNAFIALLTYRLADRLAMTEPDVDAFVQFAAALYILPFALCSATAGQIADRVDKARMMRWVKFSEVVLMAIAAAAYQIQALWLLLLLMFLMGAQSAFFAPIKYGVLPQYMRKDEMPAANGLIQGATFLAILLGQIFGAKLVLTSYGVELVSVAVVAIALIGWGAAFFAPPAPPIGPAPKVNWIFPVAMIRILIDCAKERRVMIAMILLTWFWFAGATFLSLIFQVAKFSLLASEDVALVLLTSFSVGVAAGAVIYSMIVRGSTTLMTAPWGALGIAVGSIGFCFAVRAFQADLGARTELLSVAEFMAIPHAWMVLGALIFMAMCAGLYVTPLNVEYQVQAPEGEKGRFVACSNVIDSISMSLSAGLAVFLIAVLGVPREVVFAIAGSTGFVAAWFVWRQARRIAAEGASG
ncbi:MAG: MFS transporter [Pikeienuella sp.]